ncbi:MAG: energy-coupled thiamine transporter ThiT [Lachnospirales bacterium]
MTQNKTKQLVTTALLIALGTVLSFITLFSMPMGGSVTPFSMLPIILIGYLYGLKAGLLGGFVFGILGFIIKPYFYAPMQFVVDYVFAFSALGLSGLFSAKKSLPNLYIGYTVSVFGRLVFAVLSGVIFFAEYTPEGMSAFGYSLTYNGLYLGAELAITFLILPIVYTMLKKVGILSSNVKSNTNI